MLFSEPFFKFLYFFPADADFFVAVIFQFYIQFVVGAADHMCDGRYTHQVRSVDPEEMFRGNHRFYLL